MMKFIAKWRKYLRLGLIGGSIPVLVLSSLFLHLSQRIYVPIVIILLLIFAAMALWAYANGKADGSEWWQDNSASGWRGY